MKNAANKVKTWFITHLKVTITGKIKLGFIEIAVVPKEGSARVWKSLVCYC